MNVPLDVEGWTFGRLADKAAGFEKYDEYLHKYVKSSRVTDIADWAIVPAMSKNALNAPNKKVA